MALGWLTVLKMVPWDDVIKNAPRVADGAKKLWSTVAKKPPGAEEPRTVAQPGLSPDALTNVKLQAQLAAALAEIATLHEQMRESSELIKALADQNTQLIKRVEVNRVRVLWLAGVMTVLGVVVVINLIITLAG